MYRRALVTTWQSGISGLTWSVHPSGTLQGEHPVEALLHRAQHEKDSRLRGGIYVMNGARRGASATWCTRPFDDLCHLLERMGFERRTRGSHNIFRRPGVAEKPNLQRAGAKAKPYQVRQVRASW